LPGGRCQGVVARGCVARGSGHAKWLTLRRKCHNNVSKSALIDRFSSKTALLRDSTKNGSCKKTLYSRLCLAYNSQMP
jgi:hypothetical protein